VPTIGSTSAAGSPTTDGVALVELPVGVLVEWLAAEAVAGRIIPVTVSAAIAVVVRRAPWARREDNVVTGH
jgi:hypothetical protein